MSSDILKLSLCGIIAWNLLWCIGLMNVEIFVEIDDVYMPHNGPRAEERDDFVERFADKSDKYNMILYHGDMDRAGLYEHAKDIEATIKEMEVTWDGITYTYDTISPRHFWAQTNGQPLRYSKIDCFQEGGLDFHTVGQGAFDNLIKAGQGIAAVASPLDTTPSSFTGPWLNPYTFCLWADVMKVLNPADFEASMKAFGDCKKFLNPDPESTFPVLQKVYDWVNFMFFDLGFAAQQQGAPCKVHTDFAQQLGPMLPSYDDCALSRGAYENMSVAQRNAAANAVIDAQQLTKPEYWQLNDRVVTDQEVTDLLASQCYMWDGGPNGATNALPPIPNGITNRNDGLLTLYFTKAKEDFCAGLSDSKEWDCYTELFDYGDKFGESITVHNSNGFSDYTTESDAVESYKAAVWIVIGGLCAIIVYVLIVGFCHGTPLLFGAGVFMLLSAMVASVGVGSAFGVGLTPPMLTVFPLLTMGIGVDDMFILTCDPTNAWHSIPSITTTSTINILVGCLGFTNPIPYVANFSLYFGIGSFMLYLTNALGVYSLCTIFFGPKDIGALTANNDIEMTGETKKEETKADTKTSEVDEGERKMHPAGRWLIVLSAVVLTAMLIVFPYQDIEQNMGMNMLYKKDSTAWDFFVEFREAGELHTVTLVTKDTDFAHMQADWPVFIQQIAATQYSEAIAFTWLELFQMWGNPTTNVTDPKYNTRCSPTDFNSAGDCGPNMTPSDGIPALTDTEVAHPAYVGASSCIILPEALWICDGVAGGCDFGEASGPETAASLRFHPDKFDLCVSKWVDVDNLWITAQAGFQCLGANDTHVPCDTLPPKQGLRRLQGGRINASKTSLYLKGVEVVIRDWIRYIADVREVRENSPFDTYLYGSYHNAFSSFENIWDKVYFSFAVCMAVVFVVITVSITVQVRERCGDNTIPMAVCTSIITCAFMSMAFFCTVSTLSLLDLPMMPPTMVIILLTLGIAVEVMGHIGQEYVKTKGSRSYKARTALMNLWWPLGNGLVTTILAVSIFFAAKWYFLSDMIGSIILVSLFVTLYMGLLVFPAALSVFGPPYCGRGGSGKDGDL